MNADKNEKYNCFALNFRLKMFISVELLWKAENLYKMILFG